MKSKTIGQNQFANTRKVIRRNGRVMVLAQQIQNTNNNVKDKIERRKHGSYCWS